MTHNDFSKQIRERFPDILVLKNAESIIFGLASMMNNLQAKPENAKPMSLRQKELQWLNDLMADKESVRCQTILGNPHLHHAWDQLVMAFTNRNAQSIDDIFKRLPKRDFKYLTSDLINEFLRIMEYDEAFPDQDEDDDDD